MYLITCVIVYKFICFMPINMIIFFVNLNLFLYFKYY